MFKFAVIGTGWIGGIHAERLQRTAVAKLACAFDRSDSSLAAFAERYGCEQASSVEDACKRADAVIIGTSTVAHKDIALAAIAARKPFLMEKPVTHDLASAIAVRDAALEAKIPAMTGLNRRFDSRYRRIRDAVREGRVGRVESLRFTVKTANPPSADFLRTSGGLFGEFGIHFFDLARWIAGEEPVEVFATGATLTNPDYEKIGQIDTAAVIVRMQSGMLFQLDIGWRAAYGHDERLEVFGEKGVLAAGDPVITLALPGEPATETRERLPDWFERFEATYLAEIEAFVRHIREGSEPSPSLNDGVVAQMLAEAAGQSVKLGAPVAVDAATMRMGGAA